jgi:para-nitrobenzyl esterase
MRSLLPISLVLLSASGLADTPTVRTDTGLVQGVLDDNVIVYKGIPFAAPPVGHLDQPHMINCGAMLWSHRNVG